MEAEMTMLSSLMSSFNVAAVQLLTIHELVSNVQQNFTVDLDDFYWNLKTNKMCKEVLLLHAQQ